MIVIRHPLPWRRVGRLPLLGTIMLILSFIEYWKRKQRG